MQHNGEVKSAAFSPDGAADSAPADQTARLWEASSGEVIGLPMQHDGNFCPTPRKGSIHTPLECNRLISNWIHLLQRYTPLSTCWRTRRAVAARRGISEKGFRYRMATAANLYGRNEFRKQPEPVNVAEIVREFPKSRS